MKKENKPLLVVKNTGYVLIHNQYFLLITIS